MLSRTCGGVYPKWAHSGRKRWLDLPLMNRSILVSLFDNSSDVHSDGSTSHSAYICAR
jgi:hypothetical protein